MRILLDTHCWLWMQVSPERLSRGAIEAIQNPDHQLFLSAASSWEIAVKHALGKLALPEPPSTYVPSRLLDSGVEGLPVEHGHALRVAELPLHHRDPFDRLLVAQAQLEGMALLTVDEKLELYDVELLHG